MTSSSWYVFVEEDRIDFDVWEPTCLRPEWSLVHGEYVEGGEEDARDVGERLAREHVPELMAVGMLPGDRPHRGVYRVPDGSLLVRVKGRHRECRFRVSVGELVYSEEEITAPRPEGKAPRRHATLFYLRFLLFG
ncbi:hypothetical protein ABT382_26665 [Streptomyces pharetrae]|uniref:hypothetical protein n=1 Tax=Streptomyces pharetrae TaxID=291370 RepID=UPI0033460C9F